MVTNTRPGGQKTQLHPRNRHRARYDFPALVAALPALEPFVGPNAWGDVSLDFADPQAVKMLNRALLKHHYGIEHWDIPAHYLCPPIPGRADYLHYLADLLAQDNQGDIPGGQHVAVLDIGVGANCIYPIIGHCEYGWRFTGTETDPVALGSAKSIVAMNPLLSRHVRLRRQHNADAMFNGMIGATARFDATLCNPPFHASAQEAQAATRRKLTNLGKSAPTAIPVQNFGGQANELWCEGGELRFVGAMVAQSVAYGKNCLWFTSLISKHTTLPALYQAIEQAGAEDVRTVEMAQGQKVSRFVAWTFLNEGRRARWAEERWRGR